MIYIYIYAYASSEKRVQSHIYVQPMLHPFIHMLDEVYNMQYYNGCWHASIPNQKTQMDEILQFIHPSIRIRWVRKGQSQIQDTRYKIQDASYHLQDTRYKIQDTRYKIHDASYHIQDTRYKIQDARYKYRYRYRYKYKYRETTFGSVTRKLVGIGSR